MLARGWLAYPVTSIHSHLPPKSGCRNHIPRFALSRRRATALFRNPVCKAQRSVPGFSSTPTSACRRYATSPPSAVASPIKKPALINGLRQRRDVSQKTAEERFHMLARGWLAYPVTSMHSHLPPKSGCICQHIPRFANNFYNRSSAVDSLLLQPTPGRQANLGLQLYNRPSAVAYIIGLRIVIEKIAPPGAVYHKKGRRRAVSHVSTGLACLPRGINARTTTAEERL